MSFTRVGASDKSLNKGLTRHDYNDLVKRWGGSMQLPYFKNGRYVSILLFNEVKFRS